MRKVGKATGSRERAPDERLRVPTTKCRLAKVGTALRAFAHPKLRLQQQLLHPPVQELGDIEHVLGRARHRVDPAELLELLAGLAEHAQNLAVERQLVDAAGP